MENRLVSASAEQYAYDPANERVWRKKEAGAEEIYFYGARGGRLGTYTPTMNGTAVRFVEAHRGVYFAGRAIRMEGQPMAADRLHDQLADWANALRVLPATG